MHVAATRGEDSAPLVRRFRCYDSGSSQTLVLCADLRSLHTSFGLGPRLEDAVVNDCGGRGGLLVHYRAT